MLDRILVLALASTAAFAAPKPLFQSKLLNTQTPGHSVDIDVELKGAKELFLVVTDGGNGFTADWADWAEPRLIMSDSSEKKLTDVEWKSAKSGWGKVRVNANASGGELRSAGKAIEYGIGTHANSVIAFNLPDGAQRFKARGALDEGGSKQGSDSVVFAVYTENPGEIKSSDEATHDPADAIASLDVHPECVVQLFASEPMMASPSSIDIDARGRVWVCEVVNYRKHLGERKEGDRILILEDTDHDGKADKSTVFYQGHDVDSAHGICVLGNKALISCGDDVFWLIDDNNDDKADRKELMFTKIGGAQHDHGIHAFHFGPDGRLYFNFGNAGKQLCDKDGNLITDIHGVKCTNQNNRPYQQGMVFRCELDGSNVEVLAWNFRNNWEVAVDSFGTMWQSDNDDDGNKGVRINYVMEFGNYGYSDEMTGAGWQTPRIGWEDEIPKRHWHQNDPGVIPNLLQTGAGSPTGMQVYEGDLLPSIFKGMPIHCDAGPNVVRAYVTQPEGAGYKAEIVNILDGAARDRWFRPSDVAVAPDGSLIVADWYDPGVGGHGMGDVTRGRLFRVTTKAAERYDPVQRITRGDQWTPAFLDLKSPNESARYGGWHALSKPDAPVERIRALFEDKKAEPQHRARALWLLASLERSIPGLQAAQPQQAGAPSNAKPALQTKPDGLKPGNTLATALSDSDENIRITAIRAARQLYREQPEKLREVVAKVVKDSSAAVRREAAIALRFDPSSAASELWADIADQIGSSDRWTVEALGIAGDLAWQSRADTLFANSLKKSGQASNQSGQLGQLEISLRVRSSSVTQSLATGLTANLTGDVQAWIKANSLRLLRSLQLLQYNHPAEVAKAALEIFLKADSETALASVALLSRDQLSKDPAAQARLDSLLKPVIGKPEFVSLVERLNLTGFEKELLDYILANPNAPESITAAKMLAANRDGTTALLEKSDPKSATALVNVLGRVGDRASVAVLNQAFWKLKDNGVRNTAIEALALTSEGARNILRWHSEKKLPEAQLTTAALALSRSTDAGVRSEAASALPLPAAQGLQNFPTIPELMKLKGDAGKGQQMFMQAGCVACHRVKGQFIDFGPDLSQIGNKLSKDGLFTAVLYPSAAIEHSFHGETIMTKEGQTIVGYIVSETDSELTLKVAGGAAIAVKKSSIAKKAEMKDSLMPPGLAATIGAQGLADLVAWLQTLK
ncbi:MAG: NPCBM/NEW2 domain-containing protein [Verrucomicrobiaceae bacterium]|nr:NPCBM/NEW2 domain-containing protein [Verrucomicrobiaceae bacterium]